MKRRGERGGGGVGKNESRRHFRRREDREMRYIVKKGPAKRGSSEKRGEGSGDLRQRRVERGRRDDHAEEDG